MGLITTSIFAVVEQIAERRSPPGEDLRQS